MTAKPSLWRYAVLGMVIAFAGPPIYIHTPKVYGDLHGLSLGVMGAIFLGLRLFDFLQDPLLGWAIARYPQKQKLFTLGFALMFGIGMLMLFSPNPSINTGLWLAASLFLVFTGFSGLQILYYSMGLGIAERENMSHAKIAAWRETAILVGICTACVVPTVLALMFAPLRAYWVYALLFSGTLLVALFLSRSVWHYAIPQEGTKLSLAPFKTHKTLRWLAFIGIINSIPTGITSTLFLFYVEDRLGSTFHAGPMLLVFFLSAALASPFWGYLASKMSAKTALMTGMVLVTPAFILAATLNTGDFTAFYIICIASGIALGADMTILPAILSNELAQSGMKSSLAFGLWGFITKLSFALGAAIALPTIAMFGYSPGIENSEPALRGLALTYALIPCILKLVAVGFIAISPIQSIKV